MYDLQRQLLACDLLLTVAGQQPHELHASELFVIPPSLDQLLDAGEDVQGGIRLVHAHVHDAKLALRLSQDLLEHVPVPVHLLVLLLRLEVGDGRHGRIPDGQVQGLLLARLLQGVGHQPPAPRLAGAGAVDQRHQTNLLRLQSLHCLLVHVEEMLSQEERSLSGRVGRHEVLELLDLEQRVGLELLKLGERDLHLQSRFGQCLKRRTSKHQI